MIKLLIALLLFSPQVKPQKQYDYLCRADVRYDLRYIWTESYMFRQEYALVIEPGGVSTHTDHHYDNVTINGTHNTVAVVHTHSAGLEAWPSDEDIANAKKTGVPILVLSVENKTLVAALPDGTLERVTMLDADLNPKSCK